MIFEPPSGIKASLIRTYTLLLSPERTNRAPRERAKLHFLLAWFHAVVIERKRYLPIGWSKIYEFNESD
jgi:dynein heavy chain 1